MARRESKQKKIYLSDYLKEAICDYVLDNNYLEDWSVEVEAGVKDGKAFINIKEK